MFSRIFSIISNDAFISIFAQAFEQTKNQATDWVGAINSSGAGSPFSDFTAGVAIYSFMVGVLVTVLLVGALVIINLGLLSKRKADHVGRRNPSDLGVLKYEVWPPEPVVLEMLPAEEEDITTEEFRAREKAKGRPAA